MARAYDPYYWLRDDSRKNREMLAYLAAENAYAAKVMAPGQQLEQQLFDEMKSPIKEDDSSVPVLDDGYWYYTASDPRALQGNDGCHGGDPPRWQRARSGPRVLRDRGQGGQP